MSEKYADPDVSPRAVAEVRSQLRKHGPMYPWDLLDRASVDRGEARKALRGLKLRNRVVPAGKFIGKLRLVEGGDVE